MLYWNKLFPRLEHSDSVLSDHPSVMEFVDEQHISSVLIQEFTDADSGERVTLIQNYIKQPQAFIRNILTDIFYAVHMEQNAFDALVKRLRRKLNGDLVSYGILKYRPAM